MWFFKLSENIENILKTWKFWKTFDEDIFCLNSVTMETEVVNHFVKFLTKLWFFS